MGKKGFEEFEALDDEALCQEARSGLTKTAKRVLLERYLKKIYWFPKEIMGADEEFCADFLDYAVEHVKGRDVFARFDPSRHVRFSTYFGVVLRNLYFDWLRVKKPYMRAVNIDSLDEAELPLAEAAAAVEEEEISDGARAEELIGKVGEPCKLLFKLLLLNNFYLREEEVRSLAEASGFDLAAVVKKLADSERECLEKSEKTKAHFDQLANVFWWKQLYEKKLSEREREGGITADELEVIRAKYEKRKNQYEKMLRRLRKRSEVVTLSYKSMADILNIRTETCAARLTRCKKKLLEEVAGDGEDADG